MKRPTHLISLFCCLFLLFCLFSFHAWADNRDVIVYYAYGSESAYRYHKTANCSSLSRSDVATLTLEEAAKRGYTPCTRCHPPAPDFEVEATPRPKTSSSGSPQVKERSNFFDDPSPAPTQRIVAVKQREIKNWRIIVYPSLILIVIIAFRIWAVIEEKKAKEAERIKHEEWLAERKKYFALYGSRPIIELCGAPSDCYIAEDGLPACRHGSEKWGDGYTFYSTSSESVYHKPQCKFVSKHLMFPRNAYTVKTNRRWRHGSYEYRPCSYCQPELPDLSWYIKYRKIAAIRKEFDIQEPPVGMSAEGKGIADTHVVSQMEPTSHPAQELEAQGIRAPAAPQNPKAGNSPKEIVVACLVILAIFGGAFFFFSRGTASVFTAYKPKPTPEPTVSVQNGHVFTRFRGEGACLFQVTSKGLEGYYVCLAEPGTGTKVFSFYLAPNDTASFLVPPGDYDVYYACGSKWYGPSELFGADTKYYKFDNVFSFVDDVAQPQGHELLLWLNVDDNYSSTQITQIEFLPVSK